MRFCAMYPIRIYTYSYRNHQFCVVGDTLLRSKAKTNLKKPSIDTTCDYYDVGSVVYMCSVIGTCTYRVYLKRLEKPKFSRLTVIAEPVFEQVKMYLLGKTINRPEVIDVNGPVPVLEVVMSPKMHVQKSRISDPTVPATSASSKQITIGGIEGEFFSHPCFMEFLMSWLMHTNLECVKDVRVVKLTAEQKIALNAEDKNCHHVLMKINHLPATHFFGSGFGLNQKKAFWAASRSIVRRLYHAGLITPLIYHAIGKSSQMDTLGKIKRWRRAREWKTIRNAVKAFRDELTARMPHWVQLSKDGIINKEFVAVTDEVLSANRVKVQKYESKLNGEIRRKRKADDELEAKILEGKRNKDSSGVTEGVAEDSAGRMNRNNLFSSVLPSTSSTFVPQSEILNAVADNTKRTMIDGDDANDCIYIKTVKAERVFKLGKSSTVSVHEDVKYHEQMSFEETNDVAEKEESLLPVTLHTVSIPPPPPSSLELKYQALCETLGVSCVEEALAVRSVIRQKRAAFTDEFKSFDEHIWRHFQINGQDDRTFSWKMTVRQKLLCLIRQVYENSNLIAVGSTVNGCGSYNSDMDLCLCQPYKNQSFETDRSYCLHVLKKLSRKFHTDWRHIIRSCQFIPAKVPIIKLEMAPPYEELEIDINCNNIAGIYNSHLLHYYSRIDDRFPALSLLVKHWAINAGINNAMMGTLNSYSLILMVLHFLQCATMPPILPNLQYLYPDLFNATTCAVDKLELFRDLPHPLPSREINTETVGELLIAFFDYYSKFDFKNNAISISSGCIFSRDLLEESAMRFKIYIEEPYDQQNTARCVTKFENLKLIKEAFVSARNAFLRLHSGPPFLENIGVH